MPEAVQNVFASWTAPIPLTLVVIASAILYLRGWRHLRSTAPSEIPGWRAASFLVGVFLVWLAIGSPLALLDEQLLTAHMMQHLLLMTVAPPLIWMGAPLMPMLHGLPQNFVQSVLGPFLRWPAVQAAGRMLSQPTVCWLASGAALVDGTSPRCSTWPCNQRSCTSLNTPLFSRRAFSSGGRSSNLGPVFQSGQDGLSFCTCLPPRYPATSSRPT